MRAALQYVRRGWNVIPIRPGSKRPSVKWKTYQTRSATEQQVRRWFADPDANELAIVCGAVSGGLVVIDFDLPGSYEAWAVSHPELAARCPTVKTCKGHHVYVMCAESTSQKFNGGDLKASGYVLAPPSRHPSGGRYKWLIEPNGALPEVKLSELDLPLKDKAGCPATRPTQGTMTEDAEETEEHGARSSSTQQQRLLASVSSVISLAGYLGLGPAEGLADLDPAGLEQRQRPPSEER